MTLSDIQFQTLTFLLEFFGLLLAFVEVRLPGAAARIARHLARLAAPIEQLRRPPGTDESSDQLLARTLGRLLQTVLGVGTLPVMAMFLFSLWQAYASDSVTLAWLIPELISHVILLIVVTLVLLLLSLLFYFTVVGGSDFATRFVEGRAVGTLGIMLAALGFALESYQLLTLS